MRKILLITILFFQLQSIAQTLPGDTLPWWNDRVFYEIFVRSFYDSDGDGIGDFNGITEKLDYLNDGDPNTSTDLGITGIWLMPINESPSYHGYDVVDYRSVEKDYGTMADFKRLVEEAHKRGIAVIIDFVMNHSSTEHEWFQESASSVNSPLRDFYVWEDNDPGFNGPWGQGVWHENSGDYYYGVFWGGMPDLNYENPVVKDSLFAAARYWLEDIGIDGFRLDAVKYIFEEDEILEDHPKTFKFFHEFNQVIKASNPESFNVGEAWTSSDKIVPYVTNERIDFCFEFDLANAIIGAINSGYSLALENKIEEVINLYPYYQFSPFLTNHDQDRVFDVFNLDEDKSKAAASIYLTLPGIPFLYYGEEIGMSGMKPDQNIRRPMPWDGSRFGDFTDGIPWQFPPDNSESNNVETQNSDPESLLNHYRFLIKLRNQKSALRTGETEIISNDETSVLSYVRRDNESTFLIITNNSLSERDIELDLNQINTQNKNLLYNHVKKEELTAFFNAESKELELELAPFESKIIEFTDRIPQHNTELRLFPNPASETISFNRNEIAGNANQITYEIIDLKGKVVISGNIAVRDNMNSVDLTDIRPGLYLIQINADGNLFRDRFNKF